MLTSKQRAYLRSLANTLDTILIVGKGGVDGDVLKQADDALTARELIKGKTLESSPLSARETADLIARESSSEVAQVIGSKFVLYRKNEKESKIVLPKAVKK